MAPIRRYLRITKRSVLEVRIYLDTPSDAPWLLSSRDRMLPRVMDAIRPKVLPKLREENENARKKVSSKKRGIKDVVSTEEFEVVIFLKELSTRHALLTKRKVFAEDERKRIGTGTGRKLTAWLEGNGNGNESGNPIDLVKDDNDATRRVREEEEDEDDVQELYDIPDVSAGSKRKASNDNDEGDGLFVGSDEDENDAPRGARRRKRRRSHAAADDDEENDDADEKKKLALNTSYDGFSIYGRTLCLVVKRKGKKATTSATASGSTNAPLGGSQMMEQWISTQAAQEAGLDDDD